MRKWRLQIPLHALQSGTGQVDVVLSQELLAVGLVKYAQIGTNRERNKETEKK